MLHKFLARNFFTHKNETRLVLEHDVSVTIYFQYQMSLILNFACTQNLS